MSVETIIVRRTVLNKLFYLQIIAVATVIASCNASGLGHLFRPSVVRYAPFYSFPNGVRSIHAVLPPPVPAPVLPAPAFAAPVFPAPLPAIAPVPAPVLPAPAFAPAIPAGAPAPLFTNYFPRFAPLPAPALPAPVFARAAFPAYPSVPFSPIVRAVAPAVQAVAPPPVFAPAPLPAPFAVAKTFSVSSYPHLHLYNKFLAPTPLQPAPLLKQAWK